MEIGIIEGAIALKLNHYRAHFDLQEKVDHLFFMIFSQFEERTVNALVHSVNVSNQGAVYFFFFLMSYTTVL